MKNYVPMLLYLPKLLEIMTARNLALLGALHHSPTSRTLHARDYVQPLEMETIIPYI